MAELRPGVTQQGIIEGASVDRNGNCHPALPTRSACLPCRR
jgi:hypothetical protein